MIYSKDSFGDEQGRRKQRLTELLSLLLFAVIVL